MKKILKATAILCSAFLLCSCAAENENPVNTAESESGETDIIETATDNPVITTAFETTQSDLEEGSEENDNHENKSSSVNEQTPSEESAAAEQTKNITENSPEVFSALDPVDNRISYELTVDSGKLSSYKKKSDMDYIYETEDSAASSEYLKEFFGTDAFPVDETYRANLVRYIYNGTFSCPVPKGTEALAPADGTVVTTGYLTNGLGYHIMLELDGGKVIIMSHLDEINVKPGDKVTEGQSLGVCGSTGVTSITQLGLLLMEKI